MSPQRSTTRPPRVPARVAFVGGGPGDPDLLTVRATRLLAMAGAVVVDQVARDELALRHAPADIEIVDAGHGDQGERLTQASRAKLVVRTAKAHPGGLVVRLMDGDPAVFNGLAEEAQALVKANVAFEVVPGVSAIAAVPSYAGVPLTSKTTNSIHVVAAGGVVPDVAGGVDPASTVVVLGAPDKAAETLRALVAAGRDGDTPVAVTERGTTTGQRTVVTTLADAAEVMASGRFPVLAVVGDTVRMRDALSWFETKPLFGWSVLVPRTKEQSGSMTERLMHHGARAEVVPTISVEPPRTPQQLERAVKGMVTGRYEWVGFTSVNAVRAIREKFDEFGLDARSFAGLKVAAVGGVTADALREWGINPDLVPTDEQSAQGLLDAWPPYDVDLDPINRVFLPRADIATDTLVAGLQDSGWEVDDVTAYRTVRAAPPPAPVRDAIKAGAFDAVLFTSSSTVRNLVGIAGKPSPSTVIACIGPATAKTAEEHGLRVDVMAAEPSVEELTVALADFGASRRADLVESGQPVTKPSERKAAKAPSRRKTSS